jgi:chloramphenicol O-acetyltransferase type A
MENFEHRRDRYESFARFANPLVNLSMRLPLPDFRPWCRAQGVPPFHFLLYCLLTTLPTIPNFMYRIYRGEVIRIDEFLASYTVLNQDCNLNYACFTMSQDLHEFVRRSVQAGAVARASRKLTNTGADLSERQLRENFYVTCMPWLDLAAIEHPILRHSEADIPCIAWGKFGPPENGRMTLPFAVQAHHGFVDGYHIHLLGQALEARIAGLIG